MAACSALPLLLGKQAVRCPIPPSAARARCSRTAETEVPGCSLWEETPLILRLDLHGHPHLSGYQLLLPIHGRNLHGFRSAYVMLPLAGHCWLLCPTRHQGWALGHTQPASHGARATRATGAGLCQLQGQAGIARDALEAGGRVSTIALQNTLLSRSQSQHQCP